MMKKTARLALVVLITAVLWGQNLFAMSALQKFFISATIDKWEKVQTFQGVLVETGVLPKGQELKTQIIIERPDLFYSRTLAPEERTGDFFLYDGQNIYAYYQRYHYGICLSGLQDLVRDTRERRTRRLSQNMIATTKKFHISLKKNQKIAGTTCVCYEFEPKEAADILDSNPVFYQTWSETDHYLPLKAEFYNTKNKMVYGYAYESFQVNQPLDKSRLPTGFPPGTSTSVWDFHDPALTWAQILERMNFPVSRINGLENLDTGDGKWQLKKTIAARGIVPAAALLYDSGTHFLLLTQVKDYQVHPGTERGVPVSTPVPGTRLNFFGETVLLSWSAGGVSFTLIGDLPYYTMLAVAGRVGQPDS